jgi:hypothetical protein
MKTIERHDQINAILEDVDRAATKAINSGLKFTVEWRDDGITEKQFNSMFRWFELCAKYLNENGFYACAAVTGKRIPWTKDKFHKDVYKVILKHWKEKASTKDQNTKDPDEIRLALSGHLATAYEDNIILPEWPCYR